MKKLLLMLSVFLWSGLQLAMAQSRPVRGKVLDDKGQGVPAASVTVKGTQTGTITDADGNFQLDVPDEDNTLVIEAIGFGTKEVAAGDGDNAVTVSLTQSTQSLDETVVIGYGTSTRRALIGASSVVKEEAFKDVPLGSFTNMLQGKAPGVQITAENGAPGAPAYIRVRGTGSASSVDANAPLVVIDGVPSTQEALNAINPNDIQDISILKDASTTAVYGSRGSNGVLMVTTKKGATKDGKPQITYGFQYGWKSKTSDNFKMMNFDEKLRYELATGYTNQYLAPLLAEDGYAEISDAPDPSVYWSKLRPYETDWFKAILRTGRLAQHDLSVSGSSDKINYYFSLQSYSEDGISLGSDFDRKSGSMNVEYKATDWIKFGQNIRVSYGKTKLLRDIYNAQNPFGAMYFYNPYESPYDFSPTGVGGYNLLSQGFNVIEGIQTSPSFSGTLYGLSATYLELTPVKNLTIRSQLGMQYVNFQQENYLQPGSILDGYVNGSEPTGTKTDLGNNTFNYVWTNSAQYNLSLHDMHNFKFLIGTEFTKEKYKSYTLSSKGFPSNPDLTTQNNGTTPTNTSTTRSNWALMSYFARVEYNYMGKYSANISGRRDGSSRFGSNTRYGNFVSGGLAWTMSEETFLKGNSIVNFLKLWGSIGTSGNDKIGNYDHLALYNTGGYNNQGAIFPRPLLPGNNDLTWEKNTSFSIGADFALLSNRLTGSIDYYNKYTYGLILGRPLSVTTGYSNQDGNVGAIRNSGMELSLNFDILRTRDFLWSIGGNLTLNKNRMTELVGNEDIPSPTSALGYYSVGQPIDVYYMQRSAGVDPENGDELWYMQDGTTKTNDYNEAGLFILDKKSPDPTYFGGAYTNFSYKGIELGINFYFSGGNYTYNNQWLVANSPENIFQNMATDALDYWTPTNTNASNPKPDYNNPSYDSDRWLQKADFIRLRNVTLAYNLPASLISKVKMQNLRIYIQGQNLWYHAPDYKGDPEVGIGSVESGGGLLRPGNISLYSYPQTKAITFGVNVTF